MTPICQSLKPGVSYGAACTLTGVQSGQKSGRGRIQGLRSRLLLSGLPAWLGLHGKLKEVSQICKMSCPKLWGAARQGLPSHGGKMQLFYTILIRQPSPPSLNTLQSRYFEMQLFLANSPCMNLGARDQASWGYISWYKELSALCLLKGLPVRILNFPAYCVLSSCHRFLFICDIGKLRGLCVYELTNQPTSHSHCQLSLLLFLRKHFHLAFVLRRRLPGTETTPGFLPRHITSLLMPIVLKLL